jgi:beta-galactosidase GanA
LHPLFLEKARRWFAEVCPRIARFSVTRGGPVAFAQFDNELAGIHMWFGSLDYHPDTVGFGHPAGRYPRFLADRYGDVARLNAAYETAFASFADVRPLAPRSTGHPPEVRRLRDYLHFYLDMLAEYAETLACLMRENGLDVPLVHNSAGPAMNAYFRPLRAIRHEPALRAHGSGGRMPPVVEPETDRYGPASSAGHDGQGGGVETVVGGAPLCHARPVIP